MKTDDIYKKHTDVTKYMLYVRKNFPKELICEILFSLLDLNCSGNE